MFKDPFNFVKNFRGKKSEKSVTEEPRVQQLSQEQKEQLLRNKNRSDNDPLEAAFLRNQKKGVSSTSNHSSELDNTVVKPSEPRFIKLSSGAVVDNPTGNRPYLPPDASPPYSSYWSQSSGVSDASGYHSRPVYGGGGLGPANQPPWSMEYGNLEPKKPMEQSMENVSYETLLREARMLREDLETEYNMNLGKKEELEKEVVETKLNIATARSSKPSDRIYDDIIVSLSQELTELEKKVNEIEARMLPLHHTIVDIKDVEGFIRDRELDSQQASMLFENIMKKMFDDLSFSGHVLSGEANPGLVLPRNVMDELQGKIHNAAMKRSDPLRGNLPEEQGSEWIAFEEQRDEAGRLSNFDSHDLALKKKKLAREKFQRVSMKLNDVMEFSQKKTKNPPQRAAAFRFHAVDRADAFKDVNYYPAPVGHQSGGGIGVGGQARIDEETKSTTSDGKKSLHEALQQLEEDRWLGLNQGGLTSVTSEEPESLVSSKSVANEVDSELFNEAKLTPSSSNEGKLPMKAMTGGSMMVSTGIGGGEQSDLMEINQPQSTQNLVKEEENAQLNFSIELDLKDEGAGKSNQKKSEEKTNEEEGGSLTDQLGKIQLKKPSERPAQGAGIGLDELSLGGLDINILGDGLGEGKKTTEVKVGMKVEEKKEEKKVEAAKPPAPPPKKPAGAPPPPPPPKKGPPPPPPGKKKPGAKGGPPPPPGGRRKQGDGLTRAPEVIAMFQEMRKALLGNAAKGGGGPKKIGGGSADPGALMDELAKNSKYAAQVQADVDKYGEIIQDLITEVSTFEAKDMPDMIEFVKKVDSVLSELTDETAVLKQFDWPQRYYTMLEAKGLYEELEKIRDTFKPWNKTEKKPVEELKKIQKFMDKGKNKVDVILRSKDADEKKFKDNKIPWNPKILTEVKIASLTPLIIYMELVLEEVHTLMGNAPPQEQQSPLRKKTLDKAYEHLRGAINFAFKVHQFAGGFTDACNSKFSEISTKTREIKNEISAVDV